MADTYPRTGGRLIDPRRHDERTVVGWLNDDFHHFGVTVIHDGSHVEDVHAAAPHPYAGNRLDGGFRAWTEGMPEEEAEYATVMRRAILVAGGCNVDYDRYEYAAAMQPPPSATPTSRHSGKRPGIVMATWSIAKMAKAFCPHWLPFPDCRRYRRPTDRRCSFFEGFK